MAQNEAQKVKRKTPIYAIAPTFPPSSGTTRTMCNENLSHAILQSQSFSFQASSDSRSSCTWAYCHHLHNHHCHHDYLLGRHGLHHDRCAGGGRCTDCRCAVRRILHLLHCSDLVSHLLGGNTVRSSGSCCYRPVSAVVHHVAEVRCPSTMDAA
jgi:hypothetical protein